MIKLLSAFIIAMLLPTICWAVEEDRHKLIDQRTFRMERVSKHRRPPNVFQAYEIPVFHAFPEVNQRIRKFVTTLMAEQHEAKRGGWAMFEGGSFPLPKGMMRRSQTQDAELECRTRIEQANSRYVSLLIDCETYDGAMGTHHDLHSVNYDIGAKTFLSLKDVLTKASGPFESIRSHVFKTVTGRTEEPDGTTLDGKSFTPWQLEQIEKDVADPSNFETFVFGPNWLTIYFDDSRLDANGVKRFPIDR